MNPPVPENPRPIEQVEIYMGSGCSAIAGVLGVVLSIVLVFAIALFSGAKYAIPADASSAAMSPHNATTKCSTVGDT